MRRLAVIVAVWLALDGCGTPSLPVARIAAVAGPSPVGLPIPLDGRESSGGDGPLTFAWRLVSIPPGSAANIRQPAVAVATLVPDTEGSYEVELIVGDGRLTAAARATLQVACGAAAPVVAIAPVADGSGVGAPVALSATVTDADLAPPCQLAQVIRSEWRFEEMPAGSRASIVGAQGLSPSFVPDLVGVYRLSATATDDSGRSGRATIDVNVSGCGAHSPQLRSVSATAAAVDVPVRLSADAVDADGEAGCGRGAVLSYAWAFEALPAGSRARLNGDSLAEPWFTPDLPGRYMARVIVTDETGRSVAGRVELESEACGGNAPVVRSIAAGPASVGLPVSITSDAFDPDADCGRAGTLSYAWRLAALPSGSSARFRDATVPSPEFVPDVAGAYQLELTVTDASGRFGSKGGAVAVAACGGAAPVIDSAQAVSSGLGRPAKLSVSASDADADCGRSVSLTYAWSLVSLPNGSSATVTGPDVAEPWFAPDRAGRYVAEVVVSDETGLSARATVSFEVAPCGAQPPVIEAAQASAAPLGSPVRLSVTASDPDATCGRAGTVAYAWSWLSLPIGSAARLEQLSSADAWFLPDVPGTYAATVVVMDETGRSASREVSVDVEACGSNAPVVANVAAGAASIGRPVALTADVTDPDEACGRAGRPTYAWSLTSLPSGSRASVVAAGSKSAWFEPDLAGTYRAELTVVDPTGRSAKGSVVVDVGACGANAPVIDTLAATSALLGAPVRLSATAHDADAECGADATLSFGWSLLSLPPGSAASLSDPTAAAPWFEPDVAGSYEVELVVADLTGRTARRSVSVEVGPCGANPPAIDTISSSAAAIDQPVTVRAVARDPDSACGAQAAPLAWTWRFVELPIGSVASFDDATRPAPTFVPDEAGAYVVEVTVTDATGRTATAEIRIEVSDCGAHSPLISAVLVTPAQGGVMQPRSFTATVVDDDTGPQCGLTDSADLAWRLAILPAGSRAQLSSADGLSPSLTPDVPGTYVVEVVATDRSGRRSAPVATELVVTPCGTNAPVVTITAPAAANVGSAVAVHADWTDLDNDPAGCALGQSASVAWSFAALPAGSRAVLEGRSGADAWFAADVPGTYELVAYAVDGTGLRSTAAAASVVISTCGGRPPAVVASATPSSPRALQPTRLAVAVDDPDNAQGCELGQTFTYAWSLAVAPAGSRAVITNASAPTPYFVPDVAGRFVAEVVVTDSTGRASSPSSVALEASACGLAAPTVVASTTVPSVEAGAVVPLLATASDADADAPCALATALSYAWAFDVLPAGSRAVLAAAATATPSFVPDLAGTYVVRATVTDETGRSGSALVTVAASACGTAAPVASVTAAPPSAAVGQSVTLAATATDADTAPTCGRAETFTWRWSFAALPSGSRATLTGGATPVATFVPDVAGAYTVRAVATDAAGHASVPVSQVVTVASCGAAAPVASITAPASGVVGATLRLDAIAADADNTAPCAAAQALSFSWALSSLPIGSRAVLSGATTAAAALVPDVAGTYGVRLVVTDPTGRAAIVEHDIDVGACGSFVPEAQLGFSPAALAPGVVATLSASVSDADNDVTCQANGVPAQAFAYAWELVSAPTGSRAALSSAEASSPSITPDLPGSYVVALVVTDSTGRSSAPAQQALLVGACGTNAPVASASATPPAVAQQQPVSLAAIYADADEAAACTAVTGTPAPVAYAWSFESMPSGSRAQLANPAASAPSFVPDVAGTYVATVAVTDATGRSGSARVTITASGCGSSAPTGTPSLVAGQPLTLGNAVRLLSNASDPDNVPPCSAGQALSYAWVLVEAPAGSRAAFQQPNAVDASFTPDVAGSYSAQVTVTDSTGRRATLAPVSLTVGACGGAAPVPVVKLASPSVTASSSALVVSPLLGCRMQLDASDTQDADAACGLPRQTANDLTYRWEQTAAPVGSRNRLSSTQAIRAWMDLDAGGTYEFRVSAFDGTTWSATPATARIVHPGFDIVSITPSVACLGAASSTLTLTASGQKFLRLSATGTLPAVTLSGGATVVSEALSNCSTAGMPPGIESCATMTLGVGNTVSGDYQVVVKNPVVDGCAATTTFSIAPAPILTSISPTRVCAPPTGVTASALVRVNGSNLVANTSYKLATTSAVTSTRLSANAADVTFLVPSSPGNYDVTASNGALCGSVPPNPTLAVVSVPIAYSVDPPVIYNGITTVATVYASGLSATNQPTGVLVRPFGSSADPVSLAFTYDGSSALTAGRVQVTVPSGLAPGDWEVFVKDQIGCASASVRAFTVTNTLGLALDKIDPPFGATTLSTAVDLRIKSPLPGGSEGFSAGQPRVYLNPSSGGGTALALNTVTVVSTSLANAVAKAGLPAGTYDVIAVNPTGKVGILPSAFKVLTTPPPVIDAIVPGSIPAGSAQNITVRGSGFSTPTARLDCVSSAGAAFSRTVTVSSSTATTVATQVPALTAGDLCVFVVTNANGAYGEYSALGVTGTSLNLGSFVANTSMITARRALATTYGRPTRTARFLYAIGGDNGTNAGVLSSVETATLDRYGTLGNWRALPLNLPAGRSFAGAATAGEYIYLVGGQLGAAPTNTVLRAKILDPTDAPSITDAALGLQDNALGPGAWSYRVAAVMPAGDAENPGGEGLPSDPFVVNIPTGLPKTVAPVLSWTAVTGAASYRVYRSPSANAASGSERLITTIATTTLTDTGFVAGSAAARSLGDLGVWASMPNLNIARQGGGVAFGLDPVTANKAYLYAFMGLSAAGVVDASYEYLPITIDPTTGAQTVGTWTKVNTTLSGRTNLGVFTVTDVITSRVTPGETWFYVGTGVNGAGSGVNVIDAAKVLTGGALSAFSSGLSAPNGFSGYGFASAADQLFIFGGQNASAGTSGRSSQLTSPQPGSGNWNAGIGLSTARYLHGSVVESARIFQLGGQSSSAPTNTVESVVW